MPILEILFVLFVAAVAIAIWRAFKFSEPANQIGYIVLVLGVGLWLFSLWGIGPGVSLRGHR